VAGLIYASGNGNVLLELLGRIFTISKLIWRCRPINFIILREFSTYCVPSCFNNLAFAAAVSEILRVKFARLNHNLTMPMFRVDEFLAETSEFHSKFLTRKGDKEDVANPTSQLTG